MSKEGLGDIVEIITKFTGIKWLVKKVVGEDCGCDERKEFLNKLSFKLFKSKKKISDNTETIFVQIASYRDPELIPTLEDLLSKASNPDRLHICVANQFSEDDDFNLPDSYRNDERFTIIDIPFKESKGVCWARNFVQQF